MARIVGQTRRCVRCGKPANRWGGNVSRRNGDHVIAGWCSTRCELKWPPSGWCGYYTKRMGLER